MRDHATLTRTLTNNKTLKKQEKKGGGDRINLIGIIIGYNLVEPNKQPTNLKGKAKQRLVIVIAL